MKKYLILLSMVLCISLIVVSCGSPPKSTVKQEEEGYDDNDYNVEDNENNESTYEEFEDTKSTGSSELMTIGDFADVWSDLIDEHNSVIDSYEGFPIFELFIPGTYFLSGIQYDLLNIDNKDGRFEGVLILAGYNAFLERKGSKMVFGYDDVLKENGWAPNMLEGDRRVQNGNCDLSTGYYFTNSYAEREGKVIERSISEFKKESDDSISCLIMDSNTLNYDNEESIRNSYTFVRSGKDRYDFVIGKAKFGTDFEILALEDNMTKEKAISMFEKAGVTIEQSGGIKDGKFIVDK